MLTSFCFMDSPTIAFCLITLTGRLFSSNPPPSACPCFNRHHNNDYTGHEWNSSVLKMCQRALSKARCLLLFTRSLPGWQLLFDASMCSFRNGWGSFCCSDNVVDVHRLLPLVERIKDIITCFLLLQGAHHSPGLRLVHRALFVPLECNSNLVFCRQYVQEDAEARGSADHVDDTSLGDNVKHFVCNAQGLGRQALCQGQEIHSVQQTRPRNDGQFFLWSTRISARPTLSKYVVMR
mmetsp:Transcript_32627/g.60666  ORF Transcript_32627/g.60666 Transcript_32627/m.60666 type:complete len:236 (-) Transcript_32627:289-996(-)